MATGSKSDGVLPPVSVSSSSVAGTYPICGHTFWHLPAYMAKSTPAIRLALSDAALPVDCGVHGNRFWACKEKKKKIGKDTSNSYSRDGKAKVRKAIGLLETLNSVSLCHELLFKQQEGFLTKRTAHSRTSVRGYRNYWIHRKESSSFSCI